MSRELRKTPRTPIFEDGPELYDAIYCFKDYARECDRLRDLINAAVPGAHSILDVACGTGEHAKFLRRYYTIDGIDINERYLRAARLKNPLGNYTRADMTDFEGTAIDGLLPRLEHGNLGLTRSK